MAGKSGHDLVKIGELARAAGVTTRTVRFYEDLGLIEPAKRSRGGFRLYGSDQAQRLRAVLALKKVGFSLEEIRHARELVDDTARAPTVTSGLRERAASGAARVQELITHLESVLADLRRSEQVLADCQKCDKLFDDECRECWESRSEGHVPDFLKAVR